MSISYSKLTQSDKDHVAANLELRRDRYVRYILNGESINRLKTPWTVILVGDKPGPSAPTNPGYHHTPFYSTKHCSGWLNALLVVEGIDEKDLFWLNAYDRNGTPTDQRVLEAVRPVFADRPAPIIALGQRARKWVEQCGYGGEQATHPQYHKRFRNAEEYELPTLIRALTP